MTVGLSAVNLANKWLNILGGTNITAPTTVAVKLFTGDPGASGTANASGNTTRPVVTFAAASGGSIAANGTLPSWTSWPSGQNGEVISHIGLFDSTTAGNFLDSIAATASRTLNTGDTLNLTSLTIALTPIAA